jgi:hypothetical protein
MRESTPRTYHPFAGVVLLAALLLGGDLALRTVHAAPDPAPPKVIMAQEFRLVDKTGAMRGTLQTQDDGSPGLALYDKTGKVRVTLHVQSDGSALLAFHDGMGKSRVELEQDSDGTGGLTLINGKGSGGAALMIAPDSNPVAIFKDKDGKVTWSAPGGDIQIAPEEPAKPNKKP